MVSKASGRHCASSRRRAARPIFRLDFSRPPRPTRSFACARSLERVFRRQLPRAHHGVEISDADLLRGRTAVRVVTFYGVPNTKKRKV